MITLFLLSLATHTVISGATLFPVEVHQLAKPPKEAPQEKVAAPPCWSFETRARYISGFDHLVTVKNDCEQIARCTVSTDVNPEKQQITVQAKSSETVLTYRGSPSREFSAKVECQVEGDKSPK